MTARSIAASLQLDRTEAENLAISRGLKRQDTAMLDSLIEQYQHRLLRYLLFLTSNREVAQDLFQETWIRVLLRGAQYKRQGSVRYLAVHHRAAPGHRPLAQTDDAES